MTSDFLGRNKAGILLVLYLSLSFFCLSSYVDPYIVGIKRSLWFLVSPNIVYGGEFFNRLDSLRGRIFNLIRVQGENHILREQNVLLSKGILERDVLETENNRLRKLLGLREKRFSRSVAAEVVGRDTRDWFHSLVINKGEVDGIKESAAVVTWSGDKLTLVGRIEEVSEQTSKVLLITDPVSAVSVSASSQEDIGLLEGRNEPRAIINYLSLKSEVAVGNPITTRGLGAVFPPGIHVGEVVSVKETVDGFFKVAKVSLATDFGSLQEVLVLDREEVQKEAERP